jgi:hypothetical protein
VCEGLLVTLGRGDTGTEFRSGAILSKLQRVLLSLSACSNCRMELLSTPREVLATDNKDGRCGARR